MASGTANRTDSSQIETALRHVQKTALDVWMSMGFTMALYLMETERDICYTSNNNKQLHSKLCNLNTTKSRTEKPVTNLT